MRKKTLLANAGMKYSFLITKAVIYATEAVLQYVLDQKILAVE